MTEVIAGWGLPSSLYTDRGSHYWSTPEAGGKVDRVNLTQFERAMHQLGVEMIPAYSPEARGRCERMFATHQERLPKELAARGIDTMHDANRYLAEHYRAAFNEEFAVPAAEPGTAFVPFIGPGLADVVCEHHEHTVKRDNCVSFEGKRLQIPARHSRESGNPCVPGTRAPRPHRFVDCRATGLRPRTFGPLRAGRTRPQGRHPGDRTGARQRSARRCQAPPDRSSPPQSPAFRAISRNAASPMDWYAFGSRTLGSCSASMTSQPS